MEALFGSVPVTVRQSLLAIFQYVLKDIRFGRPSHQAPGENLRMVYLEGTTPAIAGTEFSILHGVEKAPYLLLPAMDLEDVGCQIVPLTVTRVPDTRRIYLSSSVTNARICVLVEA